MKEKPIIFNTEMVKAILGGRKTQTRRIIKPQPEDIGAVKLTKVTFQLPYDWFYTSNSGKIGIFKTNGAKCPHGQPGDRLWVRETWRPSQIEDKAWYKAGIWNCTKDQLITVHDSHKGLDGKNKWKPSIHMFKKYARIWLEITDIKVERLQDITYSEIIAEGFTHFLTDEQQTDGEHRYRAKQFFAKFWDSINGKKHPWESNSWVWVIDFKSTTHAQHFEG